jgi:hypothetical protein
VHRHLVHQSAQVRALWWVAPSGWLGDRRPIDALDDEAAVIEAARRWVEPLAV